VIHYTGSIQCSVNRRIHVDVTSSYPEDEHTFRNRVPFDQLRAFASNGGRLQRSDRTGHQVTLIYSAAVNVECAKGYVHNQPIAIRAYGPAREIFPRYRQQQHGWSDGHV
jgi:hypothetical protein